MIPTKSNSPISLTRYVRSITSFLKSTLESCTRSGSGYLTLSVPLGSFESIGLSIWSWLHGTISSLKQEELKGGSFRSKALPSNLLISQIHRSPFGLMRSTIRNSSLLSNLSGSPVPGLAIILVEICSHREHS